MDRLTSHCGAIDNGKTYYPKSDFATGELQQMILNRLGAYEDTGLSPEEITCCIELLRGKCWACSNARAYRIGNSILKTCDYMKGCVAAMSQRGCEHWALDLGCIQQPGQQEGGFKIGNQCN